MAPLALLAASALVVAAGLGSSSVGAQQATCTPTASPTTFLGLIGKGTPSPTLAQCQSQCLASGCKAYWWAPGSQLCFAFDNYNTAGDFYNTSALFVTGRCGTQVAPVRGDFPGNDLSNAPAPDAVQCNYKCEDTPNCRTYSWSSYNGGTCYMKTARPDAPVGPFDGSVISGELFECSVQKDIDIVGEDLASVQRSDWRECCGVCRRTQGCIASSWNDYNGGTCWLKKTYKGTTPLLGVTSMLP